MSQKVLNKKVHAYSQTQLLSLIQVNTPPVGVTSIQTTSQNVEFPEVLVQYKRATEHLCLLAPNSKWLKILTNNSSSFDQHGGLETYFGHHSTNGTTFAARNCQLSFQKSFRTMARSNTMTCSVAHSIQPYHRGQFAGNECHKPLQNVDILQKLAEKAGAYQAQGFIETFCNFRDVVSSCFGKSLEGDLKEKIEKFKDSFLSLPVTVTPKAHAVFYHISEFIDRHGSALGLFSEQATKAKHSKFKTHWQRFKQSPSHPEYGTQLLHRVVEFNSKHA
ncbi:uncharacterized protein LOC136088569 [Hydra vulgaris]|uniref:Uncharacterized protein LOC136088569 n=1 Tax=Hydra vulgaris TaxID=6087 RepID=A0ABM4D2V8_HYDVU